MKKSTSVLFFILSGGIFLFNSCSSYKKDPSEVVLWQSSDPGALNPIITTDANGADIEGNIFQTLISFDYRTLKMVPILADSLPKIMVDSSGQMRITYEIRKEAKWDNGTPITAKDVEFTFKAIKNPAVNDEPLKPYLDFVTDMVYLKTYSENPRKFTFICNKKYILATIATGEQPILPEYVYDPNKYLEHFTLKQMQNDKNLANDPNMLAFAKDFNSDRFSRDPRYVSGSGAYRLASWTTGQRVVLEKKSNWWGNALSGTNSYFDANASKLIYQTVTDLTSALVSLKAGNIDVINKINPQDFIDLPKSDKFTSNFNAYSPLQTMYVYLGINTKNPKVSDVKTRQALAHLCDIQRMIKDVMYGYAEQTIGPLSPMDSAEYNYDIKPYQYDIDTAKALLADAGWKDSDGDGILDKVIDGKKTDLTIDFLINAGNDKRKKIALIFQEAARKLGITVNVIQQDWNVYIGNIKKHNFEMYCGGWVPPFGPQDFKSTYHTASSQNEGYNYVSFGNAASDAVIDSIRVELDDKKRAAMAKRLQVMMHYQCAYIYLWNEKLLMAINKRFSNAYPSLLYPGYWEAGFKAKAE